MYANLNLFLVVYRISFDYCNDELISNKFPKIGLYGKKKCWWFGPNMEYKEKQPKNTHNFSSLSQMRSMFFFFCICVETNYKITTNILCNIFYCCNLQLISLLVSLFIIGTRKIAFLFVLRHCVMLVQKFKWIKMKIIFALLSKCTILGHR